MEFHRLFKLNLDCEQSLSFPSVFLAFLRASVELWTSEGLASGEANFRFVNGRCHFRDT